MKPVVLDCSVTIAWCFQDETSTFTDRVLEYVRKHTALVPPLWLSEVTNVLLSACKRERIDPEGSLLFLETVSRLPIRIASLSSKEYFSEIYKVALDLALTSYDATYLYLALREDCPLATLDDKLKSASRKMRLPKFG